MAADFRYPNIAMIASWFVRALGYADRGWPSGFHGLGKNTYAQARDGQPLPSNWRPFLEATLRLIAKQGGPLQTNSDFGDSDIDTALDGLSEKMKEWDRIASDLNCSGLVGYDRLEAVPILRILALHLGLRLGAGEAARAGNGLPSFDVLASDAFCRFFESLVERALPGDSWEHRATRLPLSANTIKSWRKHPPGRQFKMKRLAELAAFLAPLLERDRDELEFGLRWLAAISRLRNRLDAYLGPDLDGRPIVEELLSITRQIANGVRRLVSQPGYWRSELARQIASIDASVTSEVPDATQSLFRFMHGLISKELSLAGLSEQAVGERRAEIWKKGVVPDSREQAFLDNAARMWLALDGRSPFVLSTVTTWLHSPWLQLDLLSPLNTRGRLWDWHRMLRSAAPLGAKEAGGHSLRDDEIRALREVVVLPRTPIRAKRAADLAILRTGTRASAAEAEWLDGEARELVRQATMTVLVGTAPSDLLPTPATQDPAAREREFHLLDALRARERDDKLAILKALAAAVDVDPTSLGAWSWLGRGCMDQAFETLMSAAVVYRHAADLPDLDHLELGDAAWALAELAVDAFEECEALSPEGGHYAFRALEVDTRMLLISLQLLQMGYPGDSIQLDLKTDLADCVAELEALRERRPNDGALANLLSVAYRELGDRSRARKLAKAADHLGYSKALKTLDVPPAAPDASS